MSIADNYRELLQRLLPKGRLWNPEFGSIFDRFLTGFSKELSRVDGRVDNLLLEQNPNTAFETIEDWEKEFGLPDSCGFLSNNIFDRRLDITEKMALQGGASQAYFISLLASKGVTITISYGQASYVGQPVGGDLRGPAMLFTWYVNIPPLGSKHFKAGNRVGHPLVEVVDPQKFICLIEKYKPAHTYAVYTFS